MPEGNTYKITIEGAGLSLAREVAKEIGEQVVVLLLTGASPAAQPTARHSTPPAHVPHQGHHALGASSATPHSGAHPEVSIREFLDSCAPKRVPDKIAAIGMYLKTHGQQSDFDKNDLISQFESAAESVPKNITRDLKWTLKTGWIALKNGSKDRFYVTNTGKSAVEQSFPKDVVKRTRGMMPGGSKKSSSAQGSED